MRVTEADVVEALRPVQDPELHLSIVELDMVRGVTIDGPDVTVLIALTVAGCPMKAEITTRVVEALTPIDGIDRVKVDMTVMTPDELEAVRTRVGASRGDSGHSHPKAWGGTFGSRSNTRVLGITSGKGGVGKSSVAVNLAVALARQGHEVGILDADVYGFSVPKMLGITEKPEVRDDKIVPPVAHGVSCVSIGFFVDDDKPVMWRGPMLHKALEQFLTDVEWGGLDFLVVDMPPGTGDVAISLAEFLPNAEVYMVTTPQPAAQRVAQRSGALAKQVGLSVYGVVETMSWFTGDDGKRYELFGAGGGSQLATSYDVPLMAQIPLVSELREGGDVGVPVVASHPESEASFAFDQLARAVEKAKQRRVYREELKIR